MSNIEDNVVNMATDDTLTFLKKKKDELKRNKYRVHYDNILQEYRENLVNTQSKKQTIDQSQPELIYVTVPRVDGSNDFLTLPRVRSSKGAESDVPRAEVPIAFSKILVASSAIASHVPDGQTFSTNRLKSRLYYDLWKRSWVVPDMNGANTLDYAAQQLMGTGTTAWRVYPKQTIVDIERDGVKTKKVIYDDIYREPMDMTRTWLGLSYKPWAADNRPEVYWEIDITNDEYYKLMKKFKKRRKKTTGPQTGPDPTPGVTEEASNEDADKDRNYVTIEFYENPLDNRYIIATKMDVLYDGEMPNEEVYGSVVVANAWHRDLKSPYGVGLWELIRGNQTIQNYIGSLNTEQVAAEVIPLIFASGNIQGEMQMTRSSTKVNTLPAGVKVERMLTTGNSTLGMNYIDRMKLEVDEITGVNNVMAGVSAENTLGTTVILKEAALNRLLKPRNSLKWALEMDSCIMFSWIEQDQINKREYIFANEKEAELFKQVNPTHESTIQKSDVSEGETQKISVFSSMKIPMNFDYADEDLAESGYEDQPINEVGANKFLVPRADALQNIKNLEEPEKIGYDKVVLVIDPNSMLTPSREIEKQVSMQLYPMIQNSIMTIFGMSRQDPEQAVAQLTSFDKFMKTQGQNVYDYIPKELFDQIMQMGLVPPPPPMVDPMTGQPIMGPGGNQPLGTPQPPQAMPGAAPGSVPTGQSNASGMGQSFNGAINNIGSKLK